MKNSYNFTSANFDKDNYYHFTALVEKLANVKRITPWEEVKEGEMYHIPKLLAFKRCDYFVHEKKSNFVNGIMKEEGSKEWKKYSLFREETRTKFMVKRLTTLK